MRTHDPSPSQPDDNDPAGAAGPSGPSTPTGQIHHNGTVAGGQITGLTEAHKTFDGPGFTVEVTPAPAGALKVSLDRPAAPEQVLRVLAAGGLLDSAAPERDRIDIRLDTTEGHDRYVYTADMGHRLLFSRAWDRHGIAGVFYGLNPFVADTDGDPADVPPRPSFRNAVGAFATQGTVARVDVMNIFTLRTPDAATLPADPADRVAIPQLERDVLKAADIVMPAWGAKGARHQEAVDNLLALLNELGITPKLRTKGGDILISGSPAQPTHTRMGGYHDIDLVDAPQEWLDGGPLPTEPDRDARARRSTSDTDHESRQTRQSPTDTEPASDAAGESWRGHRPRSLIAQLCNAGLSRSRAHSVAQQIKDWADDGRFHRAIGATKKLLAGRIPVLLDEGNTEVSLTTVLPRMLKITRHPTEIAQSILVGAVSVGGVEEFDEYPSWLELQEPGSHARHRDREGRYPVPGIQSPGDARIAYARLIGSRQEAAARQARGHASTLNAQGRPSPSQRYGWADREVED